MDWCLSSLEISILRILAGKPQTETTISGVAALAKTSRSSASRAANELEKKGFVVSERGRSKHILLSNSAHAIAARQLFSLHPHIPFDNALSHSSLKVLSAFTGQPCSAEKTARATRTPEITVRRVFAKLLNFGVLLRPKRAEYQIALSGLREFVQSYVLYGLEKKSGENGIWHCGPNGLIRTAAKLPPAFAPTGLSVFREHGIPIIQTDLRDYFFNLFDGKPKKPSFEESIAHALARATISSSSREVCYAMLAIHKNRKKLKQQRLLEAAGDFGVHSAAEHCLELVKKFGKGEKWPEPMIQLPPVGGPAYPSYEEFNELVKQYA